MEVSVVIPAYNQRERLRLVLSGLEGQTLPPECFEVLVIDDGSTDGTAEMLDALPIDNMKPIRLYPNEGRCSARNRGIDQAAGDLVVLLDGDALPAPDLLQTYLDAFGELGPDSVLCGQLYSLAELEFFQDPQRGTLADVVIPSVQKDYLESHRAALILTEAMVRRDFAAIRERAVPGGYPFPELEQMQDEQIDLFRRCPNAAVAWLGLTPHNSALPREVLRSIGGFDINIPFCEGWEIAYRCQQYGCRLYGVSADTYHLYHFHDFNAAETAVRHRAIEYMADKFQEPRIRLLYFWFAHLWPDPFLPEESLVEDLIEFDRRYRTLTDADWQQYQFLLDHRPNQWALG